MRTKQGKRTYFFLTFSMSLPGIATSSKLDSSELRGAVRTNSSGCVLFADTFEIKSAASSTLNAKRVCVSQTNRPIFCARATRTTGKCVSKSKALTTAGSTTDHPIYKLSCREIHMHTPSALRGAHSNNIRPRRRASMTMVEPKIRKSGMIVFTVNAQVSP